MAGDSPSPPRSRHFSASAGGGPASAAAASNGSNRIRTLLLVGCIVLIYLILSPGDDADQYRHNAGTVGRVQHGPAPAPALLQGAIATKLRMKFRNLLGKNEYAGYGPHKPRVAVVIVGDPDTVVGAVESVFRHTDRNRILVVVAVMDGHHDDPDLTAALHNVNSGTDVGHWHGGTYHDHHDAPSSNRKKGNNNKGKLGASAGDGDHGSQKVFVFYNTVAQGMSASRSDAVEFINILSKKHEEAGLKSPDEEIILLFLRSDGRIDNVDGRLDNSSWLDTVTDALVQGGGGGEGRVARSNVAKTGNLANAVSFHVDNPSSKPGDTITLTPSLHIQSGEASPSDLAAGGGISYPTPLVGGVATAMRLRTYNNLPASDVVLTSAAAADVELSFNLWLCGDGIDVLTKAIARVDRGNPHHSSDDMSDEEAARIMAAWMTDDQVKAVNLARSTKNGGIDLKAGRNLKFMVEAEKESKSLPKDLGRRCRPFSHFEDMFHVGIGGERADGNKKAPTLHPEAKDAKKGVGGGDDTGNRLPSKPLDPARLKLIKETPRVKLEFVDVSNGHKQHPHMGAKDENDNYGYIHDETFLHRKPPVFELPNKEQACAKRDANYRMLTEKVVLDLKADAEAEQKSKETGKPRPKILCVIFTIEKYHDKLSAISHTWGPKCDGIVYASDKTDRKIGTVNIPHEGKEEYNNIWQKNRSIWSYVYDNYYEKYDYFHSGGDDVYLLVENLRLYLESEEIQVASNGGTYLPNGDEEYQTPLFLGRRFAEGGDMKWIFNSGGSGYTLNKAALKSLVADAMPKCMPHLHTFSEDVQVARCLRKVGVPAYDTKDEAGGERYMPFQPGHHLTYRPPKNPKEDWYALACIDCKWGIDHCSDHSVAFHYIKPPLMDRMHGLLYGYCD